MMVRLPSQWQASNLSQNHCGGQPTAVPIAQGKEGKKLTSHIFRDNDGQATKPMAGVKSESKSLRWSAHRSPNRTRQRGKKTLGYSEEPQQRSDDPCPKGLTETRMLPGGSGIIVKPRRGKDNSPLAETMFDFLTSDVLVDCSTYAPFV